jgi:hypothetical protein
MKAWDCNPPTESVLTLTLSRMEIQQRHLRYELQRNVLLEFREASEDPHAFGNANTLQCNVHFFMEVKREESMLALPEKRLSISASLLGVSEVPSTGARPSFCGPLPHFQNNCASRLKPSAVINALSLEESCSRTSIDVYLSPTSVYFHNTELDSTKTSFAVFSRF